MEKKGNEAIELSYHELCIQMRVIKRKIVYMKYLLGECELFRGIEAGGTKEEKVAAFQCFMGAVYGFGMGSEEKFSQIIKTIDCSLPTLQRYVLKKSAPMPCLSKWILEHVEKMFETELAFWEEKLAPLESEDKRRLEADDAEWNTLVSKYLNIIPNTWHNCRTMFDVPDPDEDGSFLARFGFSYECRGVYELSWRFGTWACTHEKKHGHILLACEDGTMYLPHVICTQTDFLQAIEDIKAADILSEIFEDGSFDRFVRDNKIVQSLPKGDRNLSKPIDLKKTNLAWVMF